MMVNESISDIARRVFLTELKAIQSHLNGCIEGKDPIHLHDLRVANRRTRAAMSEFKDLLPEDLFLKYQKDFRWIHKITGETRDLDVSLAHIPGYLKEIPKEWRPQLSPLRELLETKRAKAHAVMKEKLASPRVQDILDGWAQHIESEKLDLGSFAQEDAKEYGCRMIVKRYRKIRDKGRSLNKRTPAEVFHDFRITIKRLRYLMEFLQPVVDSDDFSHLRTGLKIVQDAFGTFQDADVQRERLLEVAKELNNPGISPETLLALGQLIGVLEKKLKRSKKDSLRQVNWLVSDSTARTFQSCFQYPVE